jgi:hypothetical protein
MVTVEEVNEEEEAKTRAEAEARRQRILESTSERISKVEGTYSLDPNETTASTSSSRSKMAAMRRRRFNKTSKKEEGDDAKESNAATPAPSTEVTDAADKTAAEPVVTKAKDSDNETEDDKATGETRAEESKESKKKYMGVAKMRRKLIKEKLQQTDATSSEDASSTTNLLSEVAVQLQMAKKKSVRPSTLPILMHVIVVILLFGAGLDLGLQQGIYEPIIYSEFAPRRLGGIAKLAAWTSGTLIKDSTQSKISIMQESKDSLGTAELTKDEDEFAFDESAQTEEDNLDPLFGVDLDKLTAGPGLYLFMARQAIKFHRFNLKVLYYGPSSAITFFSSSPPLLCIVAVFLRQIIGKVILGAHLPPKIQDEAEHKDFTSTIKNMLSKLLSASFPMAVKAYDIFVHLRSDMYVVLCGLLVGLSLSHQSRAGSPWEQEQTVGTQTPPVQVPVKENVGMSDEL